MVCTVVERGFLEFPDPRIFFLTYYACFVPLESVFLFHECSAILDLSISPFVVFRLCSFTLVCKGLNVSPMYRFPHSHGMF